LKKPSHDLNYLKAFASRTLQPQYISAEVMTEELYEDRIDCQTWKFRESNFFLIDIFNKIICKGNIWIELLVFRDSTAP
jgi:hypothetical protein